MQAHVLDKNGVPIPIGDLNISLTEAMTCPANRQVTVLVPGRGPTPCLITHVDAKGIFIQLTRVD